MSVRINKNNLLFSYLVFYQKKTMDVKWPIFLVMMLCLVTADLAQADFLYAVTMDEEFISVDPATGVGTLIGMLDSSMDAFGLSDRNEVIYTYDQNTNRIRQLDLVTANTLKIIDIGVSTIGEGSIAFRSDGVGFLSRSFGSTGTLWSFDLTIPNSSMIGTLDIGMDGLDFDENGNLYGLAQTSYNLFTINPVNAETTLIGPTGVTSRTFLGGLTFSSDGTLYAVLNDELYTLNPGTGAATLIGPIGYDKVSGLTAVAPVPDAALLCGFGTGLIGLLRRCKKTESFSNFH
jgi:hypothetical protein